MFLFIWPAATLLQVLWLLSWYAISIVIVAIILAIVGIYDAYSSYITNCSSATMYECLSNNFSNVNKETFGFLLIWPIMGIMIPVALLLENAIPALGKYIAKKLEARARNKHPEKFL